MGRVLAVGKITRQMLVERKRYRRPTHIVSIFQHVWVNFSLLGKNPMSATSGDDALGRGMSSRSE